MWDKMAPTGAWKIFTIMEWKLSPFSFVVGLNIALLAQPAAMPEREIRHSVGKRQLLEHALVLHWCGDG